MKLILDRWQGLGDNLQVSTIPRRFYEKYGEKCVWISDSVFYRNKEIRKLVWESNPYIAGFTDEPGENLTKYIQFGKYNWIELWERLYNIEPPYSIRPEVYVKTSDVDEYNSDKYNLQERVLVDLSYSKQSLDINVKKWPGFIEKHLDIINELKQQTDKKFVVVRNNTDVTTGVDFLNGSDFEYITFSNIFEYCNAIKHCKQFICSHSGSHALASAIRKSCICLIPEEYYLIKIFVFDGIQYIKI